MSIDSTQRRSSTSSVERTQKLVHENRLSNSASPLSVASTVDTLESLNLTSENQEEGGQSFFTIATRIASGLFALLQSPSSTPEAEEQEHEVDSLEKLNESSEEELVGTDSLGHEANDEGSVVAGTWV